MSLLRRALSSLAAQIKRRAAAAIVRRARTEIRQYGSVRHGVAFLDRETAWAHAAREGAMPLRPLTRCPKCGRRVVIVVREWGPLLCRYHHQGDRTDAAGRLIGPCVVRFTSRADLLAQERAETWSAPY